MQTLSYDIEINASKQKVWEILWSADSYPLWTQFFSPEPAHSASSTFQIEWKLGGRAYFYDGEGNGLIATIERLSEPDVVIFKHIGMTQQGTEDLDSEEVKTWWGALEKYMLFDLEGVTEVHVEIDVQPAYIDMMNKGFEQGLALVKTLAEK